MELAGNYLSANVERFIGFAKRYNNFRLRWPTCCASGPARPAVVVDLSSGTGLSTSLWAGRAERALGVKPSDDMRSEAETRCAGLDGLAFRAGYGNATGLPHACTNIVTCSQALHSGQVATLLKAGASKEEIGIAALRAIASHALGDATVPFYWSYRVRVAQR